MTYERISGEAYDLVRDAKEQAGRMARSASRLTGMLKELLNGDYPVEAWGTAFFPRDDGLQAELKSPIGDARVVVTMCLGADGVQARYIFEKKYLDEHDNPSFMPVWAVRITSGGIVKSDDGKQTILDMNAFSDHQRANGVVEIALSALYAIGACETHSTPV